METGYKYIHLNEEIVKQLTTGNFMLNGVNYHIGNYDPDTTYTLKLVLETNIKE